jgi:hypothetical protein
VRSHFVAFVNVNSAGFGVVRLPPALFTDARETGNALGLNTSAMAADFTGGDFRTVNGLTIAVLAFPGVFADTSGGGRRENMSWFSKTPEIVGVTRDLLIRSDGIDAFCFVLTPEIGSSVFGALIDVDTARRTFPIGRAFTTVGFEHVEAGSAILAWIAFAVVAHQTFGEISDFLLEGNDSSL